MPKYSLHIAIVAFVVLLFMGGCSKENGPQEFRATITRPTDDQKISLSGTKLYWASGDKIRVYDELSNQADYILTGGVSASRGVFKFDDGAVLSSGPYSVVYPADARTGVHQINLPYIQYTPDGSLCDVPLYGETSSTSVDFYHMCGVVRFRLSASTDVSLSRITLATDLNTNGTSTFSGSGTSVAVTAPNGNNVTTMACDVAQSIASPNDFYMYLPPGRYNTFRVLMTAADGSVCAMHANRPIVVERGKIVTITLSGLVFTAHRFSTSATSAVIVSPGNLQYIGSANPPYWKFADRQYEYLGNNGQGSDAVNVDRDLFGWGTSGWNSGANCYQPWSTSASYLDYRPGGDPSNDLTGAYAFADWGINNVIRNAPGLWRTMTDEEQDYIFNTRSASTVNGVPDARFAKATVCGVSGLLLFPDQYEHPVDVPQPAEINNAGANFLTNRYSAEEWLNVETAGAVFFPAAGYRQGTTLYNQGASGYYWSSKGFSIGSAIYMFVGIYSATGRMNDRSHGHSVRLVRN